MLPEQPNLSIESIAAPLVSDALVKIPTFHPGDSSTPASAEPSCSLKTQLSDKSSYRKSEITSSKSVSDILDTIHVFPNKKVIPGTRKRNRMQGVSLISSSRWRDLFDS